MFALNDWTAAKVKHINKRVELHGQEVVHAKDIDWCIDVPNTVLDEWFGRDLRESFYLEASNGTLPGIEATRTELRTTQLKGPHTMKHEFSGYTIEIDRVGQSGPNSNLELPDSVVKTFKINPKQGGTCELFFRSQSTGLVREILGRIDEIDGHEVNVRFTPPSVMPDADPKNPFKYSVKANGKTVDNHPDTAPEAGDIFAASSQAAETDTPAAPVKPKAAKPPTSFKAKAKGALKAAAAKGA